MAAIDRFYNAKVTCNGVTGDLPDVWQKGELDVPRKTPQPPRLDWDKVARLVLRTLPIVPGPELYDILKDLQRSRSELGEKVKRTAAALEDASTLISDLEGELNQKLERVEKLKAEYERYQQLATLEEHKAKALIEQLQLTLNKGQSRERWIALAINLAAGLIVFILGVLLSPWIQRVLGLEGRAP